MAAADGSSIPEVGGPLTLLYAGGPERHELAEEVIRAVGFVPVRVGPIRYARNLEVRQGAGVKGPGLGELGCGEGL